MENSELIVRQPGQGDTFSVVGDLYRMLAEAPQTAGRFFLCHATVPPGGGPPPHLHHHENEAFYVLKGEITFYALDQNKVVKGGPGAFIHLPQGKPHRFANESGEVAEMLIWTTPGTLGNMFRQAGTPSPVAIPVGPDDIAKLVALAPQFGLEILKPPE